MQTLKEIRSLLVMVLVCHFAFAACEPDMPGLSYETRIDDYNNLVKHFDDPPSEFRGAHFWLWHDLVTEENIRHSLEELKEKGFGGVFVHPRYGLITEYLSDEWFDLFSYTMEMAEELGMYVWIYDLFDYGLMEDFEIMISL